MASSSYITEYFYSKYIKYSGYVIIQIDIGLPYFLNFYFNYGTDTSFHYENSNNNDLTIYEDSAEYPYIDLFSYIRANYKLKNDAPLFLKGLAFDLNILHDSHFVIGSSSGDTKNNDVFLSPSRENVFTKYLGKPYEVQTKINGNFEYSVSYGNIDSGFVKIPILKYSSSRGLCFEWVTSVTCHPYPYEPPFENDYSAYYVMTTKHIIFSFVPISTNCCLAQCFGITE